MFSATARAAVMLVFGAMMAGLSGATLAQDRPIPDTYTAVTTNMSPADVELKVDVLRWSDDEQRAGVIEALAAEDPVAALSALDSVGVVWRSGSAVGHSIKYAHRETDAAGAETITLVTDKAVGSTSFTPWEADNPAVDSSPGYSVIEMTTGASARGSMSLAAAVMIDAETNTISLDWQGADPLLTGVSKQPPPYWARTDD